MTDVDKSNSSNARGRPAHAIAREPNFSHGMDAWAAALAQVMFWGSSTGEPTRE